ncbi:MAG TPA: tyrosine-type recombinase/integrase [Verrucomicrobiae bacterium]|nr:tyrosine-type recombinase/integrase [Verrucomicrobiae bacterium]
MRASISRLRSQAGIGSETTGPFSGLRPIEVARIHWEDIEWDKGTIFIRPQTAKQVRRAKTEGRFATITEALRAWVEPVAAGKTGPVIPVKSKAMLRYKGLMEKAAGVEIPADALRHSFATYRYALDGDATATARELGHASTDITFRHYARRDVTKQDAEAWFGSGRRGARATWSRCAGRGEGAATTTSAARCPDTEEV